MGTETQQLQQEIKVLLQRLGWSHKRFARELQAMEEDDCSSTAIDISRYEERVKKHLTRPTVSPELLGRYLQQIQMHESFSTLDVSVPYLGAVEGFSEEFLKGMREISMMLDE